MGPRLYQASLKTQQLISGNGILLDVRTPIFGDTTVEELERLASDIERYNNLDYTFWTWRLYKPVENCDFIVPARENTIEIMKEVSKNHPKIWLGIRAKWEKGGMLYFKEERIINQTPDVTQEDVSEIGSGNKIIL